MDDSRIFRRDGATEPGQLLHFPQTGPLHGPAGAGVGNGHADPDESRSQPSTADLFGILWRALADILGTAAAATLLRRAAQRAQPHWAELTALAITRVRLEYSYTLPSSWKNPVSGPPAALSALTRELWPLLIDLTGPVVVQRLAQLPELQAWGVLPSAEAPA